MAKFVHLIAAFILKEVLFIAYIEIAATDVGVTGWLEWIRYLIPKTRLEKAHKPELVSNVSDIVSAHNSAFRHCIVSAAISHLYWSYIGVKRRTTAEFKWGFCYGRAKYIFQIQCNSKKPDKN